MRDLTEGMIMKKKIFIVDDERKIHDILKYVLSREGYQVFSAYNGKEALKRLNEVVPDLMILDVRMPDMNGFEVCKKVRKYPHFKKLPILMFTGEFDEESKTMAYEAGADEFLTKLISLKRLTAAVKRLLKKS